MSVLEGQGIPEFTAESTAGTVSLADYAGKRLILYFYPKDNTPGCTAEAGDFRDQYAAIQKAGAEIVGVSRDSLKSHAGFKSKLALPFELIADPDETLCELFGVMKMKNMYGKQVRGIERSTFLIGPDGKLLRAWRGLRVPGHVDEVFAALRDV